MALPPPKDVSWPRSLAALTGKMSPAPIAQASLCSFLRSSASDARMWHLGSPTTHFLLLSPCSRAVSVSLNPALMYVCVPCSRKAMSSMYCRIRSPGTAAAAAASGS